MSVPRRTARDIRSRAVDAPRERPPRRTVFNLEFTALALYGG